VTKLYLKSISCINKRYLV